MYWKTNSKQLVRLVKNKTNNLIDYFNGATNQKQNILIDYFNGNQKHKKNKNNLWNRLKLKNKIQKMVGYLEPTI